MDFFFEKIELKLAKYPKFWVPKLRYLEETLLIKVKVNITIRRETEFKDKMKAMAFVRIKINFDSNALFRRPEIAELRDESETDPLELAASKLVFTINYVFWVIILHH